MKRLIAILALIPWCSFSQVIQQERDTTTYDYYYIKGDSIPVTSIDLDEVMLLHKLEFDSKEDRRRYLILKRKTIKVYPYAKLAAERLQTLNERLAKLQKKRDRKKYTKRIQKYIDGEFSEELKKLTRTEGQILIKLVHRQTGITTFDLVKELRTGWRAFWYHNTAKMFDLSLKREFDPMHVKEDYLIEDILQRNFQSGRLDRQKDALGLDFYELSTKWLNPESKTASNDKSDKD